MKTKPNGSIKALRKIIGRTQSEFAKSIGVSKDTVVSWENGRNKLSPQFAERVSMATGANKNSLLRGDGRVTYSWRTAEQPYTIEHFRKWGGQVFKSDETAANKYFELGSDQLRLILMAAAKPGIGAGTKWRLPVVWNSFLQWIKGTRKDFNLAPQIDAILKQRRFKDKYGDEAYPVWVDGGDMRPPNCTMWEIISPPKAQ